MIKFASIHRIHQRPQCTRRLLASLKLQNYKHLTSYFTIDSDPEPSLIYIEEYLKTHKGQIVKVNPLPYPQCNDYINQVVATLPDDVWVHICDDDDYYFNSNFFKEASDLIKKHKPDIIITQFRRGVEIFPPPHLWGEKNLSRGHIGSPCFMVPANILKECPFPQQQAGDYGAYKQIVEKYDGARWLFWNKINIEVPAQNLGATPAAVNIIIPIYNHGSMTATCIKSIHKYTKDIPYRLICVDNASERQETKKWFNLLRPQDCYIRMPENVGFVKAVNKGLRKVSQGDIILLNNDTEITQPDWLSKMIEVLTKESKVGIVSCLTNNPNQWQGRYTKKDGYTILKHGNMVAFFCVLITFRCFREVGFLNEEFGVGLGDDDEYCLRAQNNGWDIALRTDVIVKHKHRTTFKSLYTTEEIKSMQENALQKLFAIRRS